jgi:hypothetical protein
MARPHRGKTLGLGLVALALYVLHQDVWLFRTARPLLFGFLPVGLTYHAGYCVACALLMRLLVAEAWPRHLEEDADRESRGKSAP